jgi:hypothetical protein
MHGEGVGRRAVFTGILLASLLVPIAARGQEGPSLNISVSATTIMLGDNVEVGLEFAGAEEPAPPQFPAIKDVDVATLQPSTQRQTSIQMINGRTTRSETVLVRFNYVLTPKGVGSFTIPPITIKHKGQDYSTQPVTIQVTKGVQQDHVLLTVSADKAEIFVGEQVVLTAKLSFDNPQRIMNYACTIPWLLNAEGFLTEPVKEFLSSLKGEEALAVNGTPGIPFRVTTAKDVNRNRDYAVYSISKCLFPTSQGERKIPPSTFKCQYAQNLRRTDDFFFGQRVVPQRVQSLFARSNDLTIKVKPLPEVGRPVDFSEAVGEYRMEVTVEPTTVRTYDPVTVKMRIFGTGDAQGIKSPNLGDATGFKTYAGDVKAALSREGGKVGGSKTFTMILEPQSPSVKEVPAATFAYFNPKVGRYETLRQGPFPIKVLPAERELPLTASKAPASAPVKGEAVELGKDLMPIAGDPAELTNQSAPIYMSRVVWVMLPMPWLLAGIAYLVQRRRERMRFDAGYARASRAMRTARRRLAEARRMAASDAGKDLHGTLAKAVSDFIADKLNLPPATVSADSARELLARHGAAPETVEAVVGFFAECDHARFSAQGAGVPADSDLLSKANALLRRLEDVL